MLAITTNARLSGKIHANPFTYTKEKNYAHCISLFQKNPHKWKKYSLDDADISDRTNTSAAFAFLAEIEKRKDVEEERASDNAMDTDDSASGKIVFKKQSNTSKYRKPSFNQSAVLRNEIDESDADAEERAVLKGSKVVMPEYVIGQKKPKISRTKTTTDSTAQPKKTDGNNKPQLKHLFEEDDEEDDDN